MASPLESTFISSASGTTRGVICASGGRGGTETGRERKEGGREKETRVLLVHLQCLTLPGIQWPSDGVPSQIDIRFIGKRRHQRGDRHIWRERRDRDGEGEKGGGGEKETRVLLVHLPCLTLPGIQWANDGVPSRIDIRFIGKRRDQRGDRHV